MKVAVGSDHAGFTLKSYLVDLLRSDGHEVLDVGARGTESTDYPDYAAAVGQAITVGEATLGVLVCGTGAGMAMAANKLRGIRAGACSEPVTARFLRSHNDANVICVGERIVGQDVAADIVRTFLQTPFSQGERHIRRILKVSSLEEEGMDHEP